MKNVIGLTAIVIIIISCTTKPSELVWTQSLYAIGSQSSPRVSDLNSDGVLDVVMGAGGAELSESDQGVIALDGRTGEAIWKAHSSAHMIGAAIFYDINQDDIDDVVIGGRGSNLMALDGKSGEHLWVYDNIFEQHPILQYARFNFYNGVLIPDQNDDLHPDLLIVNGGNWDAVAHDDSDRYPGVLMIIDITDGHVIAADTMPDGKESYMSALCISEGEDMSVIFGSGGETAGGHLYRVNIKDVLNNRIDDALVLVESPDHGFIAPPVFADINNDDRLDILTISHDAVIRVIDGAENKLLWSISFDSMESSNSLTVGQFNEDDIPDIFAIMNKGVWPNYSVAYQVMIDGATGQVAYKDSIGCFNMTSALAVDVDNDGIDEVILTINDFDCDMDMNGEDVKLSIANKLISIDFQSRKYNVIAHTNNFKNLYATPWIGDLDRDGLMDIVMSQCFNANDLHRFMGMQVKRISTTVRLDNSPSWGQYMGTNANGIYE